MVWLVNRFACLCFAPFGFNRSAYIRQLASLPQMRGRDPLA
jgi:hypothetical protein